MRTSRGFGRGGDGPLRTGGLCSARTGRRRETAARFLRHLALDILDARLRRIGATLCSTVADEICLARHTGWDVRRVGHCRAGTPLRPYPAVCHHADGRIFHTARQGSSRTWPTALSGLPAACKSPLGLLPYDLRHDAVSLWLNSWIPATEVSKNREARPIFRAAAPRQCQTDGGRIRCPS